ncbi:MAG: LptF/LptG family permease [Candidatus Saganbacteria bacterium]|nr:LptF/LptG family permease [Candidatus Saganbacteria bacterium]
MFKIIDRYIFRELVDPFFFGLGAFTAIFSTSMILFDLVRHVIMRGLPLQVAVQLFLFKLPGVMVYIFPMATLLAALLAFSRLSGDSEIIAFRAAGISVYRLMTSVIILGIIVSCITFLFYEIVVPEGEKAAQNILVDKTAKNRPVAQAKIFTEFEQGGLKRMLYAEKIKDGVMEGVIVGEVAGGKLTQIINAKEAEWQRDKETWLFKNGIIYLLTETGEYKHLIRFSEEYISIKYTPKDFALGNKSPEEMNIKELKEYIDREKEMGIDKKEIQDHSIFLQRKIALPFACLVFAFLGAPLGLTPRRTGSGVGLGISLIIVILFIFISAFSTAVGILGWLHPIVAAWLPNIVTGGIGYYILRRAAG